MHKFWGWLGLNLGKHWIRVLVIGAIVTVVLGYGITNLEFSTGQDTYLNKSDQVYKDSVAYQKLFGGEAMLTLVTMDKGHTVSELFTPETIKRAILDINPASGQSDYYAVPRGTRSGTETGKAGSQASEEERFERIEALRQEMFAAAEGLDFERAARLRDELRRLQGDGGGPGTAEPPRRDSRTPPGRPSSKPKPRRAGGRQPRR